MNGMRIFVLCAAAGFAVALPSVADAKHQRYSASFCSVVLTPTCMGCSFAGLVTRLNDDSGINSTVSHGLSGVVANLDLACPIIDTDYLQHQNIKSLNVHGKAQTSGALQAKLCYTTWSGNAGDCTAPSSSGSGDNASISFTNAGGVFAGAGTADFVYVFVRIGDTNSMLRGYFLQDV